MYQGYHIHTKESLSCIFLRSLATSVPRQLLSRHRAIACLHSWRSAHDHGTLVELDQERMQATHQSTPRQLLQLFACCPPSVGTYAAMHLDSMGKILNHVLLVLVAIDAFLFFSSWNVSVLPGLGSTTVLMAFLLTFQAVVVWLIINNNRISALSFLAPTEFMVGVALGISVGGCLLAYCLCSAFSAIPACQEEEIASGNATATHSSHSNSPVVDYVCHERQGSINAVWFWSGLVFWLNFCVSLLLAFGRRELTHFSQYESLGLTMDDYEGHFRNATGTFPGDMPVSVPHFVGDYSSVPEIRTDPVVPPSSKNGGPEQARINSV